MPKATNNPPFDAAEFWRDRMGARPDLTGTGTSGLPLAWQKWMYRGKKRAYSKLLKKAGVQIRGMDVLNFGCGTGYFEDYWLECGAKRADGIDIVPSNIERLERAYPDRTYICADVANEPGKIADLPQYDVVTAIDVIYHIVETAPLERTLKTLTERIRPGGWFLFTDAMKEYSPAAHVQFRSEESWRKLLPDAGLELLHTAPVFQRNNRDTKAARKHPWLSGAWYHVCDGIGMDPSRVNNWVALARKSST